MKFELFCKQIIYFLLMFRFNNITGQFPAIYLTSWKGRTVPENVPTTTRSIQSNIFDQRLSSIQEYEHVSRRPDVMISRSIYFVFLFRTTMKNLSKMLNQKYSMYIQILPMKLAIVYR